MFKKMIVGLCMIMVLSLGVSDKAFAMKNVNLINAGKDVSVTFEPSVNGNVCMIDGKRCEETGLIVYKNNYCYIENGVFTETTDVMKLGKWFLLIYKGRFAKGYNGYWKFNGLNHKFENGVYSYTLYSYYKGQPLVWPVPGWHKVSSYFGGRYAPKAGASTYHEGIDVPCYAGTTILAAAPGTVAYAGYHWKYGNYVLIDHGGIMTLYAHNSKLLVKKGQYVKAGQTVALAGSTGVSTGPHCHFGLARNGKFINPLIARYR